MNFISIIFFKDKKRAGIAALVPILIGICLLIPAVVSGLDNLNKHNNYVRTSAAITYVDFSDRQHPYTELTYEGGNARHVVMTKGYLGVAGREVEILYNPSDPKQFEIVKSMKAQLESKIFSAGIMFIISLPFVINYLVVLRKDKMSSAPPA